MIARIARSLAATALACVACAGSAQTLADLRNDAATPGDVITYGMGWSQQRHSPLKQIDPGNAGRLQAVWNLSLDNSANASSQPLVIGARSNGAEGFAGPIDDARLYRRVLSPAEVTQLFTGSAEPTP